MIAPAKALKTVADYAALPEGAPYQLIDGELVTFPPRTYSHQHAIVELGFPLHNFVAKRGLGIVPGLPFDVFLTEHDVYQPDILFVATDHQSIIEANGVHGAPDLIVEVLSPSTGYYDLTHKKRVYAEHGVREYWIVDPMEQTVDVLENEDREYEVFDQARIEGTVRSRLLGGFEVALEEIFAGVK